MLKKVCIPVALIGSLMLTGCTTTEKMDSSVKIESINKLDRELQTKYTDLLEKSYGKDFNNYTLEELNKLSKSTQYKDATAYRDKLMEIQTILSMTNTEWYKDKKTIEQAKVTVAAEMAKVKLPQTIQLDENLNTLYANYAALLKEEYHSIYKKRTDSYYSVQAKRTAKLDEIESLIARSTLLDVEMKDENEIKLNYERKIYMDVIYTQEIIRQKRDLLYILTFTPKELKTHALLVKESRTNFNRAIRQAKKIEFETPIIEKYRKDLILSLEDANKLLVKIDKKLTAKSLDYKALETLMTDLEKILKAK